MERDRIPLYGWPRRRRLLPALLIVGAVALDLLAPPAVSAVPVLAASPVAAAPLLSCLGTIATGLAAAAAGLVLARWHGGTFDTSTVVELSSVIVVTAFAAVINRLMARDRRRLRSARDVAEAVQRAVLPPPPNRIGPLAVAARYTAADEESAIGGDLYALQNTPYGVRLMVADVRGKGVGAVELVTVLLGAFREAADRTPALPDVVQALERAMRRVSALRDDPDMGETFATAVVAEVSTDFRTLRVANRGHPPPLLVTDGGVRVLEPGTPSLPLGLADLADTVDTAVPVDRYPLPHGSALVLFTDGVTEARNVHGTFYDPVRRLSHPTPSGPGGVLDAVLADLYQHTGRRLTDDAAMLAVVRETGPGAAPAPAGHEPTAPTG